MKKSVIQTLCLLIFILNIPIYGKENGFIEPNPIQEVKPNTKQFSLINSVDFHPYENLFCVTYTHLNTIVIYKIVSEEKILTVQTLSNPKSQLSHPQHAAFAPNGNDLAVVNWKNQTFTFYSLTNNGNYSDKPIAIINSPIRLAKHKPHGISFSPCGNFLAVAYGSTLQHQNAIALYKITDRYDVVLHSCLINKEIEGTPKGITFSPDGNSLLVTFSDTNSIAIYAISKETKNISKKPYQVVKEGEIERPEDIKISMDGRLCVISNSSKDTLNFYLFDPNSNYIIKNEPYYVLKNPDGKLSFPHGVAFSPDRLFLVVTNFGSLSINENGEIRRRNTQASKINIYRLNL